MFHRGLNRHGGLHTGVLVVVVLLSGCASTVKNTPKQDYVWAMWDLCRQTDELRLSTVHVDRVEPDGTYWSNTTAGPFEAEWPRVRACMTAQFKSHPYLDWLKTRSAGARTSSGGIASTAAPSGPVLVPVWNVGDQWEFAYKSPAGSGSYVWSVDRLETWDGTQHYVIRSGTREIFYRVADLASSIERVDGVVVVRHTPARMNYSWPLEPHKAWDQDSRDERPVDRRSTNRKSTWIVEAEETVVVPAGEFRTLKIISRNRSTSAPLYEVWYAPAAKQWVKMREMLTSGVRERELVGFKTK